MSNSQTKSLEYFAKSGEALHLADQLAEAIDQEKQAAAQLAPGLADRLLNETGLIQDHEKQAAITQLNDHAGALKVVGNLLSAMGHMKSAYEQKLAVNQGQPIPDSNGQAKQAEAAGSNSNPNYVGQRAGLGEKRASDIAFINKLGLSNQIGS